MSGIDSEGSHWTIKFPKMYMQSEISPCRVGFVSVMLIVSSQVEPLNPGAHIHSNELGELLHVPPLRQGLERHIFRSFSQFLPCIYNARVYAQIIPCTNVITVISIFKIISKFTSSTSVMKI